MASNGIHNLENRFHDYVGTFRAHAGELHPMLQLKYDHSLRVAREARDIASDLGWQAPEIRMAELIGLLHDVGRFSQYQEFRTYFDPHSVDHANRGFEVLSGSGWLAGLPPDESHLVLESVRLHSRHHLPDDLTENVLRFVNLVRDADKLDIFRILNDAIEKEALQDNPGIIWNLPRDVPPSPVIIEDLRQHRQAKYENVKSQADFCLLQLCWIYDLNYAPTRKKVAERGLVDRIARTIPGGMALADDIDHLKQYLQNAATA